MATNTVTIEIGEILSPQLNLTLNESEDMENAYTTATARVVNLRPTVDIFFDDVLVMDEDDDVRNNRLALLARVGALFAPVADFSKIQAAPKGRGPAD